MISPTRVTIYGYSTLKNDHDVVDFDVLLDADARAIAPVADSDRAALALIDRNCPHRLRRSSRVRAQTLHH